MIRRPPRSTHCISSAASDVYKRQVHLYFKALMYCKKSKKTTSNVFICQNENCNKAFTTKFSLQRHQLVHTGAKPFECQFCGKKFSLSQSMKEHLFSHTKERPYTCGINGCTQAFRHLSELSMHRRLHPEYKPRKYHYLSASGEMLGEKKGLRKFAVITTRVGRGKAEVDKESSAASSHDTRLEEVVKGGCGLDMKFLNYLVNLPLAEGKVERPTLPFPDIPTLSTAVGKEICME
eukprot:TRINITY_DN3909_c0_g1_i13.p1 TRINITY_DN3909_c0_g1~~TRINITY_DN3909_c0_g1_i13.p1  ORF type:complete len:243 (+),score=66.16 TRINITY_DN3909_c0_g1_i13:27-731(+)